MAVQYSKRVLGKVIREYRLAKNLSQEELAFEAGLARNHISRIELGRNSPSLDVFEAVAQALGLPGSIILAQAELTRPQKA